jgi:predicted DsbA family dithiol-disulfide isomerase
MSVTVDVWSDLVCPWCFIGRRRLQAALAREDSDAIQVRWRAFQLAPDLPPEGVEAEQYFNEKFGGPERVKMMHDRVAAVAADDDLELRFDLQKRSPNTRLAHRAVKLSADPDAAVETLFSAHFLQGEDIADRETVLRLLPDLDPARLDAGEGNAEVEEDLATAQQIGITGVPFFVANMRVAVSGAQPPEVLNQLIAQANGSPGE